MRDEEKWPLLHDYRRAVARGQALPILCPDDNEELVPVAGKDGDPALKCLICRSVYDLGGHVYEQMLNALADLELEIRTNE